MPAIVPLPAPPCAIILQIDPRACSASVALPMGRRLPPSDVWIDANYFAYGKPIGCFVSHGKRYEHHPTPRDRPCLWIEPDGGAALRLGEVCLTHRVSLPADRRAQDARDLRGAVAITGGPLLLRNGAVVTSWRREPYDPGIFRRTAHTAIGITRSGKLILVYAERRSLPEIARILQQYGVADGFALDGGSSASLRFRHRVWGNPRPYTLLLFSSRRK
jgi:hypothetical protein